VQYENKIREYLNPRVLFAYFLFFSSTLLTVFAYKGVNLSAGPLIESSGYLYVMILSFFFLKERITKKKIIGNILILLGIAIYTIFKGSA
jgi:small multidrug resistance pump